MICPVTKLAPEAVPAPQRGPVRLGELLPAVLARYEPTPPERTRPARRPHPMSAAWLGQQTLAALADG